MSEKWKPITIDNNIYSDFYEVSDHGNVRSFINSQRRKRKTPKVLKHGNSYTNKYPFVTLYHDRKPRAYQVHHLVLHEFVGPRKKGLEVNHKNGIKTDARLKNLEYVTRIENIRHAIDLGLYSSATGENHWLAKFSDKDAIKIIKSNKTNSELSEIYNVTISTIRSIRKGINRKNAWLNL